MFQEIEILSYKLAYQLLLPHTGKRDDVAASLKALLKEYEPFVLEMEANKVINSTALKKISASVDYFVRQTFPAGFIKKFNIFLLSLPPRR